MKDMIVSLLARLRYEKTSGVFPVKDAVNNRIFGEFADHGTVKPYVTFDHTSTQSRRTGFGQDAELEQVAQFAVRVYCDIESGAEVAQNIGDDIVEAFHFYVDSSLSTFYKVYWTVNSSGTIERVDDTVVCLVGLTARGFQDSGV
jgi:hypothetical protein